jgi:hypothetical protein
MSIEFLTCRLHCLTSRTLRMSYNGDGPLSEPISRRNIWPVIRKRIQAIFKLSSSQRLASIENPG